MNDYSGCENVDYGYDYSDCEKFIMISITHKSNYDYNLHQPNYYYDYWVLFQQGPFSRQLHSMGPALHFTIQVHM